MQIIFWIRGGSSAQVKHLMHMKHTAERLLGDDNPVSARRQASSIPFCTQAVIMGGNVRVGLEDGFFIGRGKLARGRANQVRKVRPIIEELSREVATLEQALGIPALNRASQVAL